MATVSNEEKVRAAIDKITSGKPLGSAKQRARARAALSRYGIDKQLAFTGPSSASGGSRGPVTLDELLKGINSARAMVPADPSNPSWAKGLKFVGKGLDFIDTLGSYLRSGVSTTATGIEEGDPSKVFGGAIGTLVPGLGTVVNAIDNFGGDPNAPKGFGSKFAFADKQQEKDFWANTGTGEYLQRAINKRGWQGTPIDNSWVKRVIGLAGDIGLDPLTYFSGGTKAVVSSAGKGAVKVAGKELAEQGLKQVVKEGTEQALEQTAKQVGKQGVEQAAKTGVKVVADDVAKAAADEALQQGGKIASKAVPVANDLVEIADSAGKLKPRLVQGYKAMSDLFFERARALPLDDAMRAQLEQIGANIRRARGTWVARNDELALVGAKRGIWLPGKRVIGSNSKTLESALRAREALGGGARRLVSDPAAKLFEGTFGQEKQNLVRKAARSGKGPEAAAAVASLSIQQAARHSANGAMLQLAKGYGQAIQLAEKEGIDMGTITRAVQDDAFFSEVAQRSAKAAEGIQGVRDQFRIARNMYEQATGVKLPDNPFYMPRRWTPEATAFINGKPEFAAEGIVGPADFTLGRTLRSGQDNATREVEKESSIFLGEKVPRNLSDAQVMDWANERYRYVFGEDAPQLFETDARKLVSQYLEEFKSEMEKGLFTRNMVEAGFSDELSRDALRTITGTADEVAGNLRQVADVLMGTMTESRLRTLANLEGVQRVLGELKRIAKVEKDSKTPYATLAKNLDQAIEDLSNGHVERALTGLQKEAQQHFTNARRASGRLAKIEQQRGERLQKLIVRLEGELKTAEQRLAETQAAPRGVFDWGAADRAGTNAARITDKNFAPVDDVAVDDALRIARENSYDEAFNRNAARQVQQATQPVYQAEWKVAEARRALESAQRDAVKEMSQWVGDDPRALELIQRKLESLFAGDSIMRRLESGVAADQIIAEKQAEIDTIARLMGVNPGELIPLKKDFNKALTYFVQSAGRNAAGAPSLLDKTLFDLAVGTAESKAFTSFLFNRSTRKGAPIELPVSRKGALGGQNAPKYRKAIRAEAGAYGRLGSLDATDQLVPMLQNMYARTVLSDGFKSLPPDVQNLYMRAQENVLKRGNFKNALDLYDKLNNVLKGWLIAKPGFVFRNVIGGLFMNMVDGVSFEAHFKMLRLWKADRARQRGNTKAWDKLSKFDRYVYEKVRSFMSQGDTLAGSTFRGAENPSMVSRFNPASANFFYLQGNRSFNTFAEDIVLRGSMAYDTLARDPALRAALKSGDSVALRRAESEATARAMTRINTFHFDYDKADKSVLENEVLGRVMPFYTYTKNVIPLMVSMMIERPKYFAWMNAVARNLQLGVPEDAVLPEYIRESGAIRTPFMFGGSRVYWMQDLPFNQLLDINNDPVNFAASAVTPLLKTPVELAQGQQFYKKIPITQDMKESKFANVPLLSQALSALGAQRQGDNGQQFMRDDLQYALGQLIPPAYMLGNYAPATETQQLKLPTRIVSDTTGIRLRVNTPEDQKNELARQNIKEREKKAKQTREANRGYGSYPAGYKPRKKKQQ
jgi:hypothetical protein